MYKRQLLNGNEESFNFARTLISMNYLKIDFNGGGDSFDQAYDDPLNIDARLNLRLLARACRFNLGFYDLNRIKEAEIEKIENNFGYHVSLLLTNYCRRKVIPTTIDVLDAIARDHRNLTGDPDMKVGIFIHIDEHQYMFDDIMRANKWKKSNPEDVENGLEEHKKFLYPIMTVLSSGWCFRNNVFLFPFFSGINHYCLEGLTARTAYSRKEYIHLRALRVQPSRDIIVQVYRKKGIAIENSWLTNITVDTLNPIGILSQELMGTPRYLQESYGIFGNTLSQVCSPTLIEQQLIKIQAYCGSSSIGAGLNAVLASICGLYLTPIELKMLHFPDIQSISVCDRDYGSGLSRVLIPAGILANIMNLPPPILEFLNINYANWKLPTTWEKVVASRLHMALQVLKSLGRGKVTLADILGREVEIISDAVSGTRKVFEIPLNITAQLGKEYFYLPEPLFEEDGTSIKLIQKNIEDLAEGGKPWVSRLLEEGVGTMGHVDSCPVYDVILSLRAERGYRGENRPITAFVSVKGPSTTGWTGNKLLSQLPLQRDVQQLQRLYGVMNKEDDIAKHGPLCLVYVMSRLQSKDELEAFKTNVTKLNATGQVSVAVVHNMTDFIPSLAHRLSFITLLDNPSM